MEVETVTAPAADPAAEALRIRALLESGQNAAAVVAAERAVAAAPANRDFLYMLAVGQRQLMRIPEALATLERLEDLYPDYPRLYQERGHCYVALRKGPEAVEAFEQAIARNVSLPATWSALEVLYRIVGRLADSATAAAHVRKLASLPPEIVTAYSMYADGERDEAEALIRHYLLTKGEHIEAMRLLAKIGLELDFADDADLVLARVLELEPGYDAARYEHAVVLLKQHKHVAALAQIDHLLAGAPANPAYRTLRATILAGMGRYEEAIPLFEALVVEVPGDAELHLSLAHALKTLGRQHEAIESYRCAAKLRPQYGDAYWSLANLKTYRFTDEEIAEMRRYESARRIKLDDRYHLCFALGKALEDRGQYAESWVYYDRGNNLKLTECRYKPTIIETAVRLQKDVCTADFFAERRGWGCADPAPIFIVGLPRAGSTLLEQILASHSRVEGTMELADVPRLVAELRGRATVEGDPRYPKVLTELGPDTVRTFGERYVEETRVYRTGKPHFIDKMPNNFRHIGLIHLMLPNAKIIDARRAPMDCCFSNFKQLFASGQQFTYGIENIARYYRAYVELMEHWDRVLPGRVLRVQHEDVIADLETSVRRILDYCELPFEQGCIDFHKTDRRVHTASSEQVRRPINRDGVGQWRNYEAELQPLKELLGDLADQG